MRDRGLIGVVEETVVKKVLTANLNGFYTQWKDSQ